MSAKPVSTFATLDGMRGFGALVVVIGHSGLYWGGVSLPSGPIVVDMFFLLSGYVIAFSYEPRLTKGMSTGKFMLQRLIRLYPLYALGILLGAILYVGGSIGDSEKPVIDRLGQLLHQMALLPPAPLAEETAVYAFNAPAWTLLFELAVNLIYVLIWPLLSTRVIAFIVAGAAAALALTAFTFGTVSTGAEWANFWGGFARVGFSFFLGVLLFRLAGSPKQPGTRRSWWAVLPVLTIPAVSLLSAPAEIRPVLDLLIVVCVSPLAIWVAQAIEPPKILVGLFTWLGAISYAIYILHYPIYLAVVRVGWRLPREAMDWLQWCGPVLLLVIVAIAFLATRFYDEPVRAWAGRLMKNAGQPRRSTPANETRS